MTITGSPRVDGGPDADTVLAVFRGLIGAAAPDGRTLTTVQRSLARAVFNAMTGFDIVPEGLEPLDAASLAEVLSGHEPEFRARIVQALVLNELLLHPIPADVAARVEQYAAALGVEENLVRVARKYAAGNLGLAAFDLRRTGYLERWTPESSTVLHTRSQLEEPFDIACHDDELFERWCAFEGLPPESLGRKVWEFYRARGFIFPGRPESAPPYLAQHDFVHVLGEYCSRLDGEFEVFGLIGRADPDMRGFTWIATLIGLFDTGYHDSEGLFRMDVHERWLEREDMGTRLGDAMYRGAICGRDLMAVDYFELADRPLDEVRDLLGIVPKSEQAVAAGSTSPFDPDWEKAMSEYQFEHGARS